MYKHYLDSLLGVFLQQKKYFAISVLGLAIGLAASILIGLYSQFELSYDKQQPGYKNTYRLEQTFSNVGLTAPLSSSAMADVFLKITDVEAVLSLTNTTARKSISVRLDGREQSLNKVFSATNNLVDFFNIKLINGDLDKVLNTPSYVALSRSESIRLFGDLDAIGKSLSKGDETWTIGAIFENLPKNTHLDIEALIPQKSSDQNYRANDSYTYIKLTPSADSERVQQVLEKKYQEVAYASNPVMTVKLMPLANIHLYSQTPFEMKPSGSINTVVISLALSALLIFIASFNFIKMSIAQAGKRAKEVGIRKALGAPRSQLVHQFLFEYVVIVFIAMIIALCIVELSLPAFSALIDRALFLDYFSSFSIFLLAAPFFIALLAGAYPALYISAYNAKKVLSGDLQRGRSAVLVRRLLFVIQAALSITLIIAATTIYQQVSYLKTLPLGYQKTNRIEVSGIPTAYLLESKENNLADKLQRVEGIERISSIDLSLTNSINTTITTHIPGMAGEAPKVPFAGTGFDIARTAGFEMLAGRDFDREYSSDWLHTDGQKLRASILVTEALAKQSGYTDANRLLGKEWLLGADKASAITAKVVGIIADVKVGSAKDKPTNMIFICGYTGNKVGNILMNVNPDSILKVKDEVTEILQYELNVHSVNIQSLKSKYDNLYVSDDREATLVFIFALLSVLLTCVGIYGQTSFNTYLRGKELAIRKVIGASKLSLISLMTKEFIVLMLLSIIIAIPSASFITSYWLDNFYDKAPVTYSNYVLAIITVLLIVWSTIAMVTYKTVSANLSNRLRYE